MHTGTVGYCTGLHLHIQWSCISPSFFPPPRRSHARLRPPCDTRNAGPTRPFVGLHPQLHLARGVSWPHHGRNISPGACRGGVRQCGVFDLQFWQMAKLPAKIHGKPNLLTSCTLSWLQSHFSQHSTSILALMSPFRYFLTIIRPLDMEHEIMH